MLALMLLYIFPVTVYAYEPPDESQKGSVTVEMKDVTGGSLAIYQVGVIRTEDNLSFYAKTESMEAFPDSYDDIHSAVLAENIAAYIADHHVEPNAVAANTDGKAIFANLDLGLYLIVQTEASEGYEPLKPFLISVPMEKNGQYQYDVSAEGKFELYKESEPDIPVPPDVPNPDIPNTGQLKWPIPVLTVVGLGLLSLGWILRFGKKYNYEK